MFAAVVYHVVNPAYLAGERSRLDAATRTWAEYLSSRAGFIEFISLIGAKDRVVAVSLWRSEAEFKAMLADTASGKAREAFAGMFTSLTPEFLEVSEYRRTEIDP